ncbi:MAG: DNA primase [Candidatus Bipolaricaulota bacterium]|nr:DNA primase [Candidatus Bipolaricaulota bacterium]
MSGNRIDAQAIKERVDIVPIISRYLTLKPSGTNYKGRCPFHKDDTPSFVVDPKKGLWHCFGCGEGGDVFAFLMKIERISFPEAAERLAREAGLSYTSKGDGERERLRKITAEVAEYFSDNLGKAQAGKVARDYLLGRGYAPDVWEKFGLGYALPGWDHLKRKFASQYGVETLVELGLLVSKKERSYDRFRNRVIFPIYDLSGRPIAFGGRAFDAEPKYLNSPKNPLFDKGRQLYGLHWARDEAQARRSVVLVEGYTDVISFHLGGIAHTVGSMGTALTQGQANLLSRFCDEVIIAYDPDAAGGAAALRGMSILRNSGLGVKVARLPSGEDPDSLVRRAGPERVNEILAEAMPFHIFLVDTLKQNHDPESLRGKELILEEARPFYARISNIPLRTAILTELAQYLEMEEGDVRGSLEGKRVHLAEAESPGVELGKPEEVILALVLRGEVSWGMVGSVAALEDFSQEFRPIVEALVAQPEPLEPSELSQRLDEESARLVSYLALAPVTFSDADKALQDALIRLVQLPVIEQRLHKLRGEIEKSIRAGDHNRTDELQRTYSGLVGEKLTRRGINGRKTQKSA